VRQKMSGLPSYLWKRLIFPLAFLTIIFLGLALFVPWQGFFINLTATFVGILTTLLYVDYILKQHEKSRWAPAKALIDNRIEQFANIAASQFRTAFGFPSSVFDENVDMLDPASRRREMARISQNVLMPAVTGNVRKLNQEDWQKLGRQLRITWEAGDRLCAVFGNKLEPDALSAVLDIQEEIGGILSLYSTFPDVLGVPDEKLPGKKLGSALADRTAMERIVAEHVGKILRGSSSLLDGLNKE